MPRCFLLTGGGPPTLVLQKIVLCPLDRLKLSPCTSPALGGLQQTTRTSEDLVDLFLWQSLFLPDMLSAVCKTGLLAYSVPQRLPFRTADVYVGNRKTDAVAA